jgi:hypothetical protein
MATITLRSVKGSPLTNAEVDANFTSLNNDKLETSAYTAADVLSKLLTVDGAGSGLDADLLDGYNQDTANTANAIVRRDGSGNFVAGTITAALTGTATNATNVGITDDTTTNSTHYLTLVTGTSGNNAARVSSTKLSFNPSTGVLTSTSFAGAGTGLTGTASSLSIGGNAATATAATNSTNAANIAITDDTSTNSTHYLTFSSATSGNNAPKIASTRLTFNPSTGTLAATVFSGSGASLGSLNAGNITSGTLAVARGGTAGSATRTAGAVSYGTGSAYAFTLAGTAGQILVSNGSSAPTWADNTAASTGKAIAMAIVFGG